MLIKIQPDARVCRYLFTAKLLYMFRVSQHPSSWVLKTVTAASGTGHNTGKATSLKRCLIGAGLCIVEWPTTRLAQTSPDQTSLEGSSGTSIMTCTGDCGYSFSTPDVVCCDTRNLYSSFAVNKYLHTVASGWIFIRIETRCTEPRA